MNILSWPLRALKTIRFYYNNNRKVKYAVNIFSSLVFMYFGALMYALFLSHAPIDFWKKLAIRATSTIGATTALLLVIEKIFHIEVHARELDYKNLQISNSTLDTASISHMAARQIADYVTNELISEDSVFEFRAKHYKREKKVLSENLADLLARRVDFIEHSYNKRVQIVIDSGSTLSPLFDVIGRQASTNASHWSRRIDIFTNNIKGVQLLLKYRDITRQLTEANPSIDILYNDRHLEIPVACFILPGKILSAYSAIADKSTIRAAQEIGQRADTYTICITTGNYIVIDRKNGVLSFALK
jgi:hypothetical protein